MNTIRQTVNEIVPHIYESSIEEFHLPYGTDMSRSNKCHTMSRDLFRVLRGRGIESRREQHRTADGRWHYVVAHTAIDAMPSETDIITDLNPWQYGGNYTGFLHEERQAVQEILGDASAPEWFVSLRGLATIELAHTEKLTPHSSPLNDRIWQPQHSAQL